MVWPHLGPVFGNQNYYVGLGLFFDTYSNNQHHNVGYARGITLTNPLSDHSFSANSMGTLTSLPW